jgi:hypothetical protein
MTKEELYQHHCRMFTFHVLRLLEREKEWRADMVDEISYAAFDLSLASLNEDGTFRALTVDKE